MGQSNDSLQAGEKLLSSGLKDLGRGTLILWAIIILATFVHSRFAGFAFSLASVTYLLLSLVTLCKAIYFRDIVSLAAVFIFGCLNFILIYPYVFLLLSIYGLQKI
ncbi:hypothetical protein [Lacunimicrobium album]